MRKAAFTAFLLLFSALLFCSCALLNPPTASVPEVPDVSEVAETEEEATTEPENGEPEAFPGLRELLKASFDTYLAFNGSPDGFLTDSADCIYIGSDVYRRVAVSPINAVFSEALKISYETSGKLLKTADGVYINAESYPCQYDFSAFSYEIKAQTDEIITVKLTLPRTDGTTPSVTETRIAVDGMSIIYEEYSGLGEGLAEYPKATENELFSMLSRYCRLLSLYDNPSSATVNEASVIMNDNDIYYLATGEFSDYNALLTTLSEQCAPLLAASFERDNNIIGVRGQTFVLSYVNESPRTFSPDKGSLKIEKQADGSVSASLSLTDTNGEKTDATVEFIYIAGKYRISSESFSGYSEKAANDLSSPLPSQTENLITSVLPSDDTYYINKIIADCPDGVVFSIAQKQASQSAVTYCAGVGVYNEKSGETQYFSRKFGRSTAMSFDGKTLVALFSVPFGDKVFSGKGTVSVFDVKQMTFTNTTTEKRIFIGGDGFAVNSDMTAFAVMSLGEAKDQDDFAYNRRLYEVYSLPSGELIYSEYLTFDGIDPVYAAFDIYKSPETQPRYLLSELVTD